MLPAALLAQLGRTLQGHIRQRLQAQSTHRLLEATPARRRLGVELGMQAQLELRVQGLPAADAGQRQGGAIAAML